MTLEPIRVADGLLTYDPRKMLAASGGITLERLTAFAPALARAEEAIAALRASGRARGHPDAVLFPSLCRLGEGPNDEATLGRIEAWAEERRGVLDGAISIGIGGSYLGNRMLHEALRGSYWNELSDEERDGRPRLWFAGHHLDPICTGELIEHVRGLAARQESGPLRIELIVISKSGTTTEPLAAFTRLEEALGRDPAIDLGITAVTGPGSPLAELARARGRPLFRVPDGVGGRWSVLAEGGLLTAALVGIDTRALLEGARRLDDALREGGDDPRRNPALLYAALHHLLHIETGRTQAVLMPYVYRLRALSEWYVQLLAESLGKAKRRDGTLAPTGRTPIPAVGTTDMHAQTQLHQEGPLDKTVTTIDLASWGSDDAPLPGAPDGAAGLGTAVAGRRLSALNRAAREANEEALAAAGRPSDSLTLERLEEASLGALLQFLMMSVAYEGELLDVDAYDQPGVDAYKSIMREKLDGAGARGRAS